MRRLQARRVSIAGCYSYPSVPVARLGRLAVDLGYQGRRLGGALLWDAMSRASRSEMAVFALAVDAKDDQAEAFYRHHGFVGFGSAPRQLILPLDKDSGHTEPVEAWDFSGSPPQCRL